MTDITRDMASTIGTEAIRAFALERIRSIRDANGDRFMSAADLLEAEEHSRQFSPAEEWIAGFNDREDSYEVWEHFEDALGEAAEDFGVDDR